jgi:hypothetical protein
MEMGPNDVFGLPPGHDGYVIGHEPLVTIEWQEHEKWTALRRRA